MLKPLAIVAASLSLAACDPTQGVNSPSSTVSHICHTVQQVGTAFDIIRRDLAAAGFSSAKVDAAVPLIEAGKLVIDVNCALLVPAGPPAQP